MFQQSIIHTGVNRAVNCIKTKERPSTPKIKFILMALNQGFTSRNWKCVEVVSKKNKKEKLTFRIIKDQKSEKFRIRLACVLSIKAKTKQPIKDKKIRNNNIYLKDYVQRDLNS